MRRAGSGAGRTFPAALTAPPMSGGIRWSYSTPDIGARSRKRPCWRGLDLLVIDSGGRTPAVQPLATIVVRGMLAGSRSPGVQRRSGSTYRPVRRAWHRPAAA